MKAYLDTFHIVGLVETWSEKAPTLVNFTCFEKKASKVKSKGRASGGICFLIKEKCVTDIMVIENELSEVLWLNCKINGKKFVMAVAYRAPEGSNYENENFFSALEEEIEQMKENFPNHSMILGGDFNSRVGTNEDTEESECDIFDNRIQVLEKANKDKTINKAGKQLIKVCKNNNLVILNGRLPGDTMGEFTFLDTKGCSTIDLGITDRDMLRQFKIDFKVEERSESAHMPIKITIEEDEGTYDEEEVPKTKLKKYRWNEKMRGNFNDHRNEPTYSILKVGTKIAIENRDVDAAVERFNMMYNLIGREMEIDEAAQGIKGRRSQPWYDKECAEKKYIMKKNLRSFRRRDRTSDLRKYLETKKEYKETCDSKKTEWKEKMTTRLKITIKSKNDKVFWRTIREVTRQSKVVMGIIEEERWVEHFSRLYAGREQDSIQVESVEENRDYVYVLDKEVTLEETEDAIRDMKNEKAPGIDGIPAEFFKFNDDPENSRIITDLFNLINEEKKWPREWETGIIHPIYKKGNPNEPKNYRGITLLPVISKVYTKILSKRLQYWLDDEKKIIKAQAGFRKGYMTMDNLLVLKTLTDKTISKKRRKLYTLFVDYRTAFDSVNREKLWQKLRKIGVSENTIEIYKSIYRNVKCTVKIGKGHTSVEFEAKNGVRQGCQLSAHLFAIYINDLEEHLKKINIHAPCLNGIEIPLLLFADDVTIIAETIVGLQRAIDSLDKYSSMWDLEVNVEKTKIMIMSKGQKKKKTEKWFYRGTEIEVVKEFCYLGIWIDNKCSWKLHIQKTINKAKNALHSIRKAMFRLGNDDVDFWYRIYTTMIEPIILYGAEVWGEHEDVRKLDIIITKLAKEILGISYSAPNEAVLGELNWRRTSRKAEQRAITYYLKTRNSGKFLQELAIRQKPTEKGRTTWASRMEKKIETWQAGTLLDEPFNKKRAKEFLGKVECEKELEDYANEVNSRKSLHLLGTLTNGRRPEEKVRYVTLEKEERKAIARLRMGTYIWENKTKVGEDRICPMCQGIEHYIHIIRDCPALEELRNEGISIESLETLKEENMHEWSKFLKQTWSLRKESTL